MIILAGQSPSFPLRQALNVEMSERLVDGPLPVGGHLDPPEHTGWQLGWRHVDRLPQWLQHPALAANMKGNLASFPIPNSDSVQAAARPENQGLSISSPREDRINPMDGPQVSCRSLSMGCMIIRSAPLRRSFTTKPLRPSSRRTRANHFPSGDGVGRAAPPVRQRHESPAPSHDPGARWRRCPRQSSCHNERFGGWRDVPAVIEIPTIREKTGLPFIFLLGLLLGHLETLATGAMVEPHLPRTDAASGGEMLPGDDIVTVGRPGGTVEQPMILLGHGLRFPPWAGMIQMLSPPLGRW